jgi:serine protease AprX
MMPIYQDDIRPDTSTIPEPYAGMPASNHHGFDHLPSPFDPKSLRRSTIAIPLLEAIEQELTETRDFLKEHPDVLKEHNVAVFHRSDFPGGLGEARQVAQQRLAEAIEEIKGDASRNRIDPYDPTTNLPEQISLGQLDGRVIRTLLAVDSGEKPPAIERIWPNHFDVIIDINLNFKPKPEELEKEGTPDSRVAAQKRIQQYINQAKQDEGVDDADQGADVRAMELIPQYVFARLQGNVIKRLVAIDMENAKSEAEAQARAEVGAGAATAPDQTVPDAGPKRRKSTRKRRETKQEITPEEKISQRTASLISRFRTIHHIWPDFKVRNCITQSIATVKVDAAHRSFTAFGKGITWAVMDSGIQADHPHFVLYRNIDPASPYHADFTDPNGKGSPLTDEFGHGTHVSGIIAGEQSVEKKSDPKQMVAAWRELDENQQEEARQASLETICGMAPECQLVSLKVLDRFGQGSAKSLISALTHVQEVNHHGRELHIHGVNLSLGYPFEAKWFACGHSPLCVEVNRLAKSGVIVVIAAGNSGYGTLRTKEGDSDATLELTINDPGNAEYAITVGSTHREMPHMYGVSYFSSKGPTGDGRYKPDLLAPGERIISCAAPQSRLVVKEADLPGCNYFEQSGTSMAAPHVSGAIAAFLSIRREFIGEAEAVKKIFTSAATDLGRSRHFQGSGLLDLMRAIQSV